VGILPESVVNLRIKPPLPSCWRGCGTRLPFRGGDTSPSKDASFRGDCWLRKRSSSIRSLVLFEYAILKCYNTINSQFLLPLQTERAGQEGHKVGFPERSGHSGLPPGTSSRAERRKYLKISKKERMRASWGPRRAKQMSYPSRSVEVREVKISRTK
jgi:hypothetical protein